MADLDALKGLHRSLPGLAFVFADKVVARQRAGGLHQLVQIETAGEGGLQVAVDPVDVQGGVAGGVLAAHQGRKGQQAAQQVGGVDQVLRLYPGGGGEQGLKFLCQS